MKRIISILLAVWFACSLCVPAFAQQQYIDVKLREGLPLYRIDAAEMRWYWGYEDIVRHKTSKELRAVYRDEKLIGQVCQDYQNRDWREQIEEGDFSIAYFIQTYGKKAIILEYKEDRFVIFKNQKNTLYALSQFANQDLTEPVPYAYSLPEYYKAAMFLERQPDIPEKAYREFKTDGVNDELIQISQEYWQYHEDKNVKQSVATAIIAAVLIVSLLAAVTVLVMILHKKGKLKINNDFINKIWVPALKKWRN